MADRAKRLNWSLRSRTPTTAWYASGAVRPAHRDRPAAAVPSRRSVTITATEDPMPVNAYVLIQTEVGKAATVARTVSTLDGVLAAEGVTGPYDVIVRTEAETVDDLGRMVVGAIQRIEGITRTVTCPVVNL
jgi:DNA-binding Lrp family transcriptional regulator